MLVCEHLEQHFMAFMAIPLEDSYHPFQSGKWKMYLLEFLHSASTFDVLYGSYCKARASTSSPN